MHADGMRQSDRVNFTMVLEAIWNDADGKDFAVQTHTVLVSRNGAVLLLKAGLPSGQELLLRRVDRSNQVRAARAHVVAEIGKDEGGVLYAVALDDSAINLWDIEFPPIEQAQEALARLLMECSFCQRREVAYLSERDLKTFEARKCIARYCQHCETPAIFTQALPDNIKKAEPADTTVRVNPSRNRTRVKARILACIRHKGFSEEVAVCEDLSRGGLSFRSRNKYPEGSRVEVAVPFTPGSGNIFVPVRIVFSQQIPAAGLYRHGAAYIRLAPSDSE